MDVDKVFIVAAFHDFGIWTRKAFDYLGPSRMLARDYLIKINRAAWAEEVKAFTGSAASTGKGFRPKTRRF